MRYQRSLDEYYPRSKRVVFILQRGNHIVPVSRENFKKTKEMGMDFREAYDLVKEKRKGAPVIQHFEWYEEGK